MNKMFLQKCSFILFSLSSLGGWSSLSIHGNALYNTKALHLSYANPLAPKGGRLRLGIEGTFDSLNPYSWNAHKPLFISLVFQTLGEKTLDDPHTFYPQIAEEFILSPDRKSLKVKLFKNAKFSDAHPLSSEDVAFSFTTLRSDEANPYYRSYWKDISGFKIINKHEMEFQFARVGAELPALVTDIPVLPKHVYGRGRFSKDFARIAVGSGPYIVEEFKFGSGLTFKRNPKFWAKDFWINKGRFNFDHLNVQYFRDQVPLVQAFNAGVLDFFIAYTVKTWRTDLVGRNFDRNWIRKEEWKHQMNLGALGYFFNLRNPLFQDVRVRKAISLAFDFAWTNKTVFDSQYLESQSLFENSEYKASGFPDAKEKTLLSALKKEFPSSVPDEVFSQSFAYLGKGVSIDQRLQSARTLLKEAGYRFEKGEIRGPAGTLSFRLLLRNPSDFRIAEPFRKNLERLGIKLRLELFDRSVYVEKLWTRNFDLAALLIPSSASPGQEQLALWHSQYAAPARTKNYSGLSNPAVDRILEKLVQASSIDELKLATRSLDRLVYHLHIAVPNWYADKHRVAFWNKFGRPKILPPYFFENEVLEFMWIDPLKEEKLRNAMKKAETL